MVEVETPKLEKEVLVKVKSFSVNPIDYLVRSGQAMKDLYKDLSPRIIEKKWRQLKTIGAIWLCDLYGKNYDKIYRRLEEFGLL